MIRRVFVILFAIVMCACTAPAARMAPESAVGAGVASMSPMAAVMEAAAKFPGGVNGDFLLTVRASGADGRNVYLNSELDYRDQRNLTVTIPLQVAVELARQLGAEPGIALKGRQLLVRGEARRTTIQFNCGPVATDKYYFQTHVLITDPAQIRVLDQSL